MLYFSLHLLEMRSIINHPLVKNFLFFDIWFLIYFAVRLDLNLSLNFIIFTISSKLCIQSMNDFCSLKGDYEVKSAQNSFYQQLITP